MAVIRNLSRQRDGLPDCFLLKHLAVGKIELRHGNPASVLRGDKRIGQLREAVMEYCSILEGLANIRLY